MLLRITLLSMCCVSVGMSQERSHPLLGKWRSVETSKGGIGAIVDFHSNGTFDYSPGAVIGGCYRVENNRLVTTYDNGDPETTMTIESVTDTVLRLSVDKGARSITSA